MSIVTLPQVDDRQKIIEALGKDAESGNDSAYGDYDEARYDLFIDVVETIAHCGDVGAAELCQAALGSGHA